MFTKRQRRKRLLEEDEVEAGEEQQEEEEEIIVLEDYDDDDGSCGFVGGGATSSEVAEDEEVEKKGKDAEYFPSLPPRTPKRGRRVENKDPHGDVESWGKKKKVKRMGEDEETKETKETKERGGGEMSGLIHVVSSKEVNAEEAKVSKEILSRAIELGIVMGEKKTEREEEIGTDTFPPLALDSIRRLKHVEIEKKNTSRQSKSLVLLPIFVEEQLKRAGANTMNELGKMSGMETRNPTIVLRLSEEKEVVLRGSFMSTKQVEYLHLRKRKNGFICEGPFDSILVFSQCLEERKLAPAPQEKTEDDEIVSGHSDS